MTSDEFRIITNNLHLNFLNIGYKHYIIHLKSTCYKPNIQSFYDKAC